jgi:hypothetical protein
VSAHQDLRDAVSGAFHSAPLEYRSKLARAYKVFLDKPHYNSDDVVITLMGEALRDAIKYEFRG